MLLLAAMCSGDEKGQVPAIPGAGKTYVFLPMLQGKSWDFMNFSHSSIERLSII
jgi:hypothetical protein